MTLRAALRTDGRLTIGTAKRTFIDDVRCMVPETAGGTAKLFASLGPWRRSEPSSRQAGELGWVCAVQRPDSNRPFATLRIRQTDHGVLIRLELLRALDGLSREDSFETSATLLPVMTVSRDLRFFLVTYGLGELELGDGGGYWPTAAVGDVDQGFPPQAFAPVVLYDDEAALAIAPSSQFLTSAMISTEEGLGRALHGAVDRLEAGTSIETTCAFGSSISDALHRLGNALLARGGKRRPLPAASPLTSALGWWNAYGSFYTEPIRPLDEGRLLGVAESLRQARIPCGYVGLDLWYPYQAIGQAVAFHPDPVKYPRGVKEITQHLKMPAVLHLSALAPNNVYGTDGADPTFYADVARRMKDEGAFVAWHDWLRTQQVLSPALRQNPETADGWFAQMGKAFETAGLDVLLCMQTMGMVLASTAMPNAVAARSFIDYLFGQPEAIDTLDRLGQPGFRKEAVSRGTLWRQNLLVGFVLEAFGLLPFHDLFLSRPHAGLGGTAPLEDALLRALSCGPVGIGDGPAASDADLLRSLVSSRDTVLQPDYTLRPDPYTLGGGVETYRTGTSAGDATWEYVLLLNPTREPHSYKIPLETDDRLMWDLMRKRLVTDPSGTLAPDTLICFLLAPAHAGICPLGLIEKLVPAPHGVLLSAARHEGWTIRLSAPGECLGVWAETEIRVVDEDGRALPVQRDGGLHRIDIDREEILLEITRR